MKTEDVCVEYAEISQEEGDELLYQVYELLLSDTQVVQNDQSPAPETGYNRYA